MATDADEWHREVAIGQFNRCWDLIDQADRSPDDEVEMLSAAMTSRWHWAQIGGDEQVATGDWQVAHVAALLGHAELARIHADRCLAVAETAGWTGWRLASAHEGVARAAAVASDTDRSARHVDAARAALETEDDPESAQIVMDQLSTIPSA